MCPILGTRMEADTMTVMELSREQLQQLKQRHLMEKGAALSWGELASIDEVLSDKEIFEAYEGVNFVEDDFFS